jgi:hypothetical protein
MGSNHELDRIPEMRNLLILRSHRQRQKHQKQGGGTKSVQQGEPLNHDLCRAAPRGRVLMPCVPMHKG